MFWNGYNYSFVDPRTGTQGMNDCVAVEPFPKTDAPVQVAKSGFVRDIRRGSLVGLKVIHGNNDFPVGAILYTKSENAIQPWAKDVLELNGVSFIMIPKTAVLLREYSSTTATATATYTPYAPYGSGLSPAQTTQTAPFDLGSYEIGTDGIWRKKE